MYKGRQWLTMYCTVEYKIPVSNIIATHINDKAFTVCVFFSVSLPFVQLHVSSTRPTQ